MQRFTQGDIRHTKPYNGTLKSIYKIARLTFAASGWPAINKNISVSSYYWSVQTLGWLGFLLLSLTYFEAFKKPTLDILLLIFEVLLLFSATQIVRTAVKRLNLLSRNLKSQIVVIVPICIAMSMLVQCVQATVLVEAVFYASWSSITTMALFSSFLETLVVISLWTSLYVAIKNIAYTQHQRLEKIELNLALKESELKALRAQLNPHFLFNCLNNIRSVILSKPDVARDTLSRLSDLLRYTIVYSQKASGSLEDELTMVQDYLELEKLQFGERLSYSLTCPRKLYSQTVPTMSIQLLVENAVKHGIATRVQGGSIDIDITETNNMLDIRVNNSGTLQNVHATTGIGIPNLKLRLSAMFGDRASLQITQPQDGIVSAQLKLPMNINGEVSQ